MQASAAVRLREKNLRCGQVKILPPWSKKCHRTLKTFARSTRASCKDVIDLHFYLIEFTHLRSIPIFYLHLTLSISLFSLSLSFPLSLVILFILFSKHLLMSGLSRTMLLWFWIVTSSETGGARIDH